MYAARRRAEEAAEEARNRPVILGMRPQHVRDICKLLGDLREQGSDDEEQLEDLQVTQRRNPQEEQFHSFYNHMLAQDTDLDDRLQLELETKQTDNWQYRNMQEFRKKLPSHSMRQELLRLISENQVVVISGETGCGKTTQVPQFILDHHIQQGQGSTCRVICTQPRRISAISVAERVACERGEACGSGNSTGYQIRLEAQFPRQQGCILYCTNGILLKWLESDQLLQSVSHVVLDEVHERDIISDFLLVILKDILPKRPTLKLILMSATLNAELFSTYFDGCPMANIPGFTFPVEEYWLEDVLQMTKYTPPEQHRKHEPIWLKFGFGKRFREELKKEEEFKERFSGYIAKMRQKYPEEVVYHLKNMDHENMDLEMVSSVIRYICLNKPEGALLVFLPGWEQISKVNDLLTQQQMFQNDNFRIIPLHSMIPTINQRQVFEQPPPGVRKIVIATNIAETSITIDDVVYVINLGRIKERNFDVENNLSTLKPEWISAASASQRRGRAGRVQPGECYHLYSQLKAAMLADYQLPEMLRTPLDELCLQIKSLKLGSIHGFIEKALQQPDPRAVDLALESLTQMNALNENEELTPLGYHLAWLPVSPAIGRMILFGAMFCCLDPILTIAASLSFKDPFVIPLGKEETVNAQRKQLSGDTFSDHLMLVNAVAGWEEARNSGRHAESDYCWSNFMSITTLKMLGNMKTQFCELLASIGFVAGKSCKQEEANKNSDNKQLVKAILCSGLYPNVARVTKGSFNMKEGKYRPAKIMTRQDGQVKIHPKSVNFKEADFPTNWILYHLKLKSTNVYLHDTSAVGPYPLLFFGGKIGVTRKEGSEMITVDDHIKFFAPARIAYLVKELRFELDKLLQQKISQPGMTCWRQDTKEGRIMMAIIDLITTQEDSRQ
ncbi:ATP-dependent RNA helicase DHX36-like [Acanthaster planci]|uniref:ATP-dependent DNA/RNA helicase DHX36 n=1 Tax=Acanthaster planci TaxID=133434 RepID=A0A8B7YA46_ACAPL|nr:ATP-dependent RNA helicase DHX36-like [Acanthaster planci]XP_022089229.1 ATP-dependent RNA helicase DHX36-like [Acanthaster planci]XP_022089237.1 ATP-dependent RNA helicase DHX36-like [Acanthaster planci]XP_022089245.1 ATP-dependent RNA helicase DHX36-like [Acanthaster planci]